MKQTSNLQHWYRACFLIFFLLFVVLVVLSNHNDWDQFFSMFEVDLRSWLVDKTPPYWSYQLCAGSTRVGDPQAFGLSPLFLSALIFGSFWGSKVMVLLLTLLGFFSLKRLFRMTHPVDGAIEEESQLIYASLGFFLLFGNYYLGHIHGGQLTFALLPLAFYIFELFFRSLRENKRASSLLLLFLSVFSYCTAGFYHSLIFFVIPAGALAMVTALFRILRTRTYPSRHLLFPILTTLTSIFLGVGLASYKWLAVVKYQAMYPRSVEALPETNSLAHLLAYFFLPTFNLRFAGIWEFLDQWGVAEYSVFSFPPFGLAIAIVWIFVQKNSESLKRAKTALWIPEFLLCGTLATLLCLGDSSPIPIFRFMNATLFQNSIRVIGRYHIILVFLSALFLARLASVHAPFRSFYLRRLLPLGFVISAISMLSFFPTLSWNKFLFSAFSPTIVTGGMNQLIVVPPRIIAARSDSFMYNTLKAGGIVLNCYQPINRETRVATESGFLNEKVFAEGKEFDLLSPGSTPLSKECQKSAYVTQNEVFFNEQSCPSDLCFKLNMLNPYIPKNLVFNKERQLFCVR